MYHGIGTTVCKYFTNLFVCISILLKLNVCVCVSAAIKNL